VIRGSARHTVNYLLIRRLHLPSLNSERLKSRGHAVARSLVFAPFLCLLLTVWSNLAAAIPQIEIEGLMPNAAIVLVDGQRKMLKVGQTFNGVTLVASGAETATLEVEGRQLEIGLTRRVGTNYQPPAQKQVTIRRDARLQYITTAYINGRRMPVLVDTGANILALNETHARRLGLNLENAAPGTVETAAGVSRAWQVTLQSVDVGGIRVDHVLATVLEGDYPSTALLGMSYLRHVKIEENQGVLTLIQMH